MAVKASRRTLHNLLARRVGSVSTFSSVMSNFTQVLQAPADPILGLNEAFAQDPRPHKINLGVGVYKDAHGKTPVLSSVKKAEQLLLTRETSKSYLPIDGSPTYNRCVLELLFGRDAAVLATGRVVSVHTPGGTGALRVAADFLSRQRLTRTIWISCPTWPNHPQIFQAAGLETAEYRYFDATSNALDWENFLADLDTIPAGDAILLHGCCHNPTGVDPSRTQWQEIARRCAARGCIVLFDLAYQGFAEGVREDAACLEAFLDAGCEFFVASSYSKNFGLYNERVGGLSLVLENRTVAQRVLSQIKMVIRANYSNPSSHGGATVATILTDQELRAEWESELAAMRERINGMRRRMVETLQSLGARRDFSFIARQRGMFSFSGLNQDQVQRLKDEFAIYAVGSGRINVAGLTEANLAACCQAIAAVL